MRQFRENRNVVQQDNQVIAPFGRAPYYPLAVKRAQGTVVEDEDGNTYLDFLGSAAVANTGHCHPKVVEAIQKQAAQLIHYTTAYMYNKNLVKLANELIRITPGKFPKKVFFGVSGSDANDGAIKLARAYTGRPKIMSFIRSYYGSTYGAASLSAISPAMKRKIGPFLPDVEHIPYPDCYRCPFGQKQGQCRTECLGYVKFVFENYVPPDKVAAVIMEPIQGDGGIIVPPAEYVTGLFELCRRHGILFVSEEVQQGFGRTGRWFGVEHFGVEPDMVVMGKAMGSGLPISAIVARSEIMESLDKLTHAFTLGGNAVAVAAALATIEVIEEEGLVERARELGDKALARLNAMREKYGIIGDVRGKGLSIGVDLVIDRETKARATKEAAKIVWRAWEKGLLLAFFSQSVLRIQPPLTITDEELGRGLDIIEESIADVMAGRVPDSVLDMVKGW